MLGKRLKGLGFIGSQLVLIAIASWSIFSPSGNTVTGLSFLFLSAIIYIFNLFDAYAYANKQLDVQVAEKIPRIIKDPWFAVFLSRILPGLGQLYLEKTIIGGFLLSLLIIFSSLASVFPNLTYSCSHHLSGGLLPCLCRFSQASKTKTRADYCSLLCLSLLFGLVTSYLPTWIEQEIDLFEIPSKSMLPTLEVGDRIFVNKSSDYSPQRGDVMVFKEPDAARLLESEDRQKQGTIFRQAGNW
jgi:signal peptidase I